MPLPDKERYAAKTPVEPAPAASPIDVVEEASRDSFPASDAPGWTFAHSDSIARTESEK